MKIIHFIILFGLIMSFTWGAEGIFYNFKIIKSQNIFSIEELTIEKSAFVSEVDILKGDYSVILEGIDGNVLHKQMLNIPSQITIFHDTLTDKGLEGFGEIIESEKSSLEILIPYFEEGNVLKLLNPEGKILTEKNLLTEQPKPNDKDIHLYLIFLLSLAIIVFLFYKFKR